jgi:glycosyltransferase involved in cell wall biosynthesis
MPVRVAHITTADMSLRFLLLNQLKDLKNAGYDVTGISSSGEHVECIEVAGIRHIAVPMTRRASTPAADVRSLVALYQIIRQHQFDIVHTHTPKAGLLGRLAARLARVSVVVHTSHGFIFQDHTPAPSRQLIIALEKLGAACCDLVLSVNHEDVQTAIREGICAAEKVMPLGDGGIGIDLSRFDPTRFSQEYVRSNRLELGIPAEGKVVGFVGRLVREKGVLELLEAAQRIYRDDRNTRFLIVGPVDSEKSDAITPSAVHEYGLAEACIFTGRRHDVENLMSLMDIFVLPSYREGLPVVLLEAAAMGVPVVATRIRGCREAVEEGRNGLLVPAKDASALYESISRLLNNPVEARWMGEEGRRMACDRFDERLVFSKVRLEYARLLRTKSIPVPDLAGA